MNSTKRFTRLAAGLLALSGLAAAPGVRAGRPPAVVAVFSQADFSFSETVTLYADGKYRQSETQREVKPPRRSLLQNLLHSDVVLPASLREPKRSGTWRVLDKGGAPVPLKAGAVLPPDAVVELKGAMPFGMTWDNRLPYGLSGDRTVPTGSFQAAPAIKARA